MTEQRVSDEELAKLRKQLISHGPYNVTIPTHELEALCRDLRDARAKNARLSAELEAAKKDADQGYGMVKSLRQRLCKTLGLDQAARDMDIFDRIKTLADAPKDSR